VDQIDNVIDFLQNPATDLEFEIGGDFESSFYQSALKTAKRMNEFGFVAPQHHANYADAVQRHKLDKVFEELSVVGSLPYGRLSKIAKGMFYF
jgi:hypothetical protein